MQRLHNQMNRRSSNSLKKRLFTAAVSLIWAGGLLLAGSDGPMMPYLNGVGVILFAAASLWLGRHLPELTSDHGDALDLPDLTKPARSGNQVSAPSKRPGPAIPSVSSELVNSIRPRFARELGVV